MLAEVAQLLHTPNIMANVNLMRHDPWWWPMRKDSWFLALLDDPKNNELLF